MNHRWLGIVGAVLSALLGPQVEDQTEAAAGRGPYARIAVLRPHGSEQALPEEINPKVARTTVEILTLRPTMSLGLGSPTRE